MADVTFLETPKFTKWKAAKRLTADVEKLKARLASNPAAGDPIQGTGGVRKIRMAGAGRGTRGGFRVIYAAFVGFDTILLIAGYGKSKKTDLTADEKKKVKQAAEAYRAALEARKKSEEADE